jgi:hypothetical protein
MRVASPCGLPAAALAPFERSEISMRSTRAFVLPCLALASLLLLILPSRARASDEDGSVDVVLTPDASPLVPSSSHTLSGRLYALEDLSTIHIDLSSSGPVTLPGPLSLDLGALAAGDSVDFSVPVSYDAEGTSDVHLDVTLGLDPAADAASELPFDFWAVIASPPHHSATSMGDAEAAQFKATEADSADGTISQAEADSLEQAYVTAPEDDSIDSTGTAPSLLGQRTVTPDGRLVANVTVIGKITWTDKNDKTHPAIKTRVELWDYETIGSDRLLASDLTDETGTVSFTVPNDDGFLGGGIDAYLRLYTSNPYVYLHATGQNRYAGQTIRKDNLTDNATYTYRVRVKNTVDAGRSWSVFQALTQAALYAETRNGAAFPQVDATWPTANGCAFSVAAGILVRPTAVWEWDPIMHEYGHYVQSQLNTADNPGGPHKTNCLSVEQGSKSRGVRMAWGEGWATYFGIVAQAVRNLAAENIPDVGDVYYDSFNGKISISLEAQDNNRIGEDCEWAVSRHLWDLYDTADDGYESISLGDATLWDRVKAGKPTTLSALWGILRGATANAGEDLAIANVAANHQTGAVPTAPADGAEVMPGTTFSWPRVVECSVNKGNSFDMAFFTPGTPPVRLAQIATMANLANPTHDLTAAEFNALLPQTDGAGNLLWAVEARNTGAPATGPYLGLAQTIHLTAPVATLVALQSSDVTPEQVTLTWFGSGASGLAASVERSDAGGAWQVLGPATVSGVNGLTYVDRTVSAGSRYSYRLVWRESGAEHLSAAVQIQVPLGLALALEGFRPNPSGARPSVAFTKPDAKPLSIEVLDVAGRRVLTRDFGSLAAGRYVLPLGGRLVPGVYLVRLRAGGKAMSTRGVVMP